MVHPRIRPSRAARPSRQLPCLPSPWTSRCTKLSSALAATSTKARGHPTVTTAPVPHARLGSLAERAQR